MDKFTEKIMSSGKGSLLLNPVVLGGAASKAHCSPAFSLMEMMVVLLIMSIIAAATAPIISKRMVSTAKGESPWVWSGIKGSIAYNLNGNENMTATIGTTFNDSGTNARLYINSKGGTAPHLSLGHKNNFLKFIYDSDSNNLVFTKNARMGNNNQTSYGIDTTTVSNASAFGYKAYANANATSLGANSTASGEGAVAVGTNTSGTGSNSIAIGSTANVKRLNRRPSAASGSYVTYIEDFTSSANAGGNGAIAIGGAAVSNGENSVTIGYNSNAKEKTSIAIGNMADAEAVNSIAIGNGTIGTLPGNQVLDLRTQATEIGAIVLGNYSRSTYANAITVGSLSGALGKNAIAIGIQTIAAPFNDSDSHNEIAIGNNAKAINEGSIAIGTFAKASGYTQSLSENENKVNTHQESIAIGNQAESLSNQSIAIGANAKANHNSSTAIGLNAQTTAANQIVLGTANETVYIPGNLRIEGYLDVIGNARVKKNFVVYQRALLGIAGGNNNYPTSIRLTSDGKYSSYVKLKSNNIGNISESAGGDGQDENSWFPSSDRRLKNVGEAFKGGLEEIRKLEVFNYTFKKDPEKTPRVGVIAQDLMKIFPNAVFKGEDGFYKIRMEDMFYALVNAVKELDNKVTELSEQIKNNVDVIAQLKQTVDSQQNEIAELKKQNAEFEKRNAEFEKRLAKLEKRAK